MCKQLSFLTILLISLLLLTSCTTPAVAPTPSPTTIVLTPMVTPTLIPITSPRIEPYSVEECEAKLEAIIGIDVRYSPKASPDDNFYFYINETINATTHLYVMNRLNGTLASYSKDTSDTSTQKLNIEDLEQTAIDELKKFCPSLFDLEVEVKKNTFEDGHHIRFFQLSPVHQRRTGNSASVTIQTSGDISSFSIQNDEDPTLVDKPVKISKQRAINIAYKACQDYIEDSEDLDFDVFFDERDTHEVTAILAVWKGSQRWHVDIKNIPSNKIATIGNDHPICMFATICADTGEVLGVGGTY